ncbi:thioredoxin domain-containing protein [Chloroflexi bacterium TSY]|nr:thioredoxin domain-containing protein [Chloroflexi bacterium TSY]
MTEAEQPASIESTAGKESAQPQSDGQNHQEADSEVGEPTGDAAVGTDNEQAEAASSEQAVENEANSDAEISTASTGELEHSGEPNRLIHEKSPYLLQHAYNPVDWYPWGEEAFAKAAAEDKPIFLSIGYSTCHWCHVMRDESFEDEEVAALMNETFVAIKLDREERPDIDDIYINVAHLMQVRGGWPLNVVLTPEQKPFFVTTYVPKETRFQRAGMLDLVPRIEEAWQTQRDEILTFANQVTNALQPPQMSQAGDFGQAVIGEDLLGSATLTNAFDQLNQRFDPVYGGFGTSPKFPSPHNMLFLLRYWQRTGDENALEMVETTLKAMRRGGVYDQIGFGFHRYSTDQQWKLPHFEKMLYDQAMLGMAYTETYEATENEAYQRIAREIFTYVLRDMTDPLGGFYSAEDADSEGEEGTFYMWTNDELIELLGLEDANFIIQMAAMTEEGNFLEEATREAIGKNIVYWDKSVEEVAAAVNLSPEAFLEQLEPIRQKLFDIREERIHPHKDDKILTDWNGLMIVALSKAARAFDEPAYTQAATKAADFLLTTMRNDGGRLLHRYRDGEAGLQANIDDYAFLIWGLLELYETTFDLRYLEEAISLNQELETYFWDEFTGGFFFTPEDGEKLIARQKAIYDGAIPSGNSVSMLNLLKLGRITADADYEARAAEIGQAFSREIESSPTAYTQLMSALEFGVGPSLEVVIVGEEGAADTEALLSALRDEYVPNKVVLLRGPEDDAPIIELADYTKYYYAIEDSATAYVCQNYVCEFPTNDPEIMVALLSDPSGVGTSE